MPARATIAILAVVASLLAGCVQATTTPTATPAGTPQVITIEAPPRGATISSPLVIRGATGVLPLASQLSYRIFDQQGSLVASGTLPVTGPAEGPGRFDAPVSYRASQAGPGRLEVVEVNPTDGSTRAIDSINVVLTANEVSPGVTPAPSPGGATAIPTLGPTLVPLQPSVPQQIIIETPLAGTAVGSPLTVTGRTAAYPPGGTLNYLVRNAAGAQIGAGAFSAGPAPPPGGGTFSAVLTFAEPQGGGPISVEISDQNRSTAVLSLNVAAPQSITIDTPPPGTLVGSPMTITGRTARPPFQGTLSYRITDLTGQVIGSGLIGVGGAPGQPGSFVAELSFRPPATSELRVELADEDAVTGAVAARQSLALRVSGALPGPTPPATLPPTPPPTVSPQITATAGPAPAPAQIVIESPAPGAVVSGSLTIVGRVGATPPSGQLRYRVRDAAGRVLGEGVIAVVAAPGQPAQFSATISLTLPNQDGPIALEVLDSDPGGLVRSTALVILQVARPTPYPGP